MGTGGDMVRQWVSDLLDKKDDSVVFKVLLIGDCVGKSSLVLRFCKNEFLEESELQFIPMTIGLDVKSKLVGVSRSDGNTQVQLNLWDTAGQDRFRKFNEEYLPKADAVILLYDVRSLHSLKETRPFIEDVRRFCDESVVKFLVGNKDDIDSSRKVVSTQTGADFASSIGFCFMETSARDNRNVDQLFHLVAKLCLERRLCKENL